MNKILILGGTGFVGRAVITCLRNNGFEPVIFSRNGGTFEHFKAIRPDAEGLIPAEVLSSVQGLINLAGETINQRWNSAIKKKIHDSRVNTTEKIAIAVQRNRKLGLPYPQVLVNASAIGYYGNRPQGIQTENSPAGSGFLADVCRQWEDAAFRSAEQGLRVVIFRFGVVLGPGGGIIDQLSRPFRFGVGGFFGSGKQYLSWIHRKDLARIILLAIADNSMSGVYNATSPEAVTMLEFTDCFARILHRPNWLRIPEFAARALFGEMAGEVLLADQQVYPLRLSKMPCQFHYERISDAIDEIFGESQEN